jgi:hypothetical protein
MGIFKAATIFVYSEPNLSTLQIFTDGSRLDGKAGAALAIYKQLPDRKKPDLVFRSHAYLGEEASVFQAEVHPLIRLFQFDYQKTSNCIAP